MLVNGEFFLLLLLPLLLLSSGGENYYCPTMANRFSPPARRLIDCFHLRNVPNQSSSSSKLTNTIDISVPPKWVKVPKDIEFTAGQNMVIDCQAKAYPSARVWSV